MPNVLLKKLQTAGIIRPVKDTGYHTQMLLSHLCMLMFLCCGLVFMLCYLLCWAAAQLTRPVPRLYRAARMDIDRLNDRLSDILRFFIACHHAFGMMEESIFISEIVLTPIQFSQN